MPQRASVKPVNQRRTEFNGELDSILDYRYWSWNIRESQLDNERESLYIKHVWDCVRLESESVLHEHPKEWCLHSCTMISVLSGCWLDAFTTKRLGLHNHQVTSKCPVSNVMRRSEPLNKKVGFTRSLKVQITRVNSTMRLQMYRPIPFRQKLLVSRVLEWADALQTLVAVELWEWQKTKTDAIRQMRAWKV